MTRTRLWAVALAALIGIGALSALVIASSGAFYFKRMERIFADVA